MSSKNQEHLERAKRIIPWGTQTNAKRHEGDGMEARPAFIQRAKGCRMWDLDGREFIDFRVALGPIILGYQHPGVDEAVRRQMELGTLFSMASPIEVEAAEKILKTIGWADKIRFMKTGADACTCCVRLARSRTGRDHLLSIGYHGYHDSFALAWPKPGVPEVLRNYIHEVAYGDTTAVEAVFEEYGTELAAAITVPIEWHLDPDPAFLQRLRELCDHYGAALVFDEILTGFRLAKGGAVKCYGIVPDLAAYAKGLANGYPLSAYTGKSIWMDTLEQTIITTTYAGETLSLAAACAVMDFFEKEPVQQHIARMGKRLRQGFEDIFQEAGFPARMTGVDQGPVIDFSPAGDAAKSLHPALFNRLYAKGIFANAQWFTSYAHQESDIDQTLDTMREAVNEVL
ncbi:MAG: aminotransferase class III-fold pyridoxal phosphate-dependent enzyme [Verrucomicrobiae bacterium]|nr:aminotransferase class III-fold pyridoxal phosphate-dependent enzyme [Verrucomicrobiae bacterium]